MKKILFLLIVAAAGCKGLSDATYNPEDFESDVVILNPIEVVPQAEETYNPSDKKVNDLLHTRLEVSFDWGKQHLLGKARMDFKPYFYPTDRLILDAKGFDIHKVELVTDSTQNDLQYTYDDWYLDIDLGRKYSRFEKYTINVEYTAKPNELPVGGSDAILNDKGLYFINPDSSEVGKPTQIWTQGQTESSSCWFPTIDSPNERMTQEIFINVDKRFTTLSNGELVYSNFNADGTRTDYWQQSLSHPPYLVMMAVGDFIVAMDQWEKESGEIVPVNYYMEKEYAPYAYNIFGNTPEMIQYFSDLLDYEYPWSKYSQVIVRDYVSGAMENTTAVIHGEFLNATDREMLDGDNEDVISHELFHHWFGDLVTCESWANLPLNESFATYGEYLWNEHKYGKDDADYWGLQSMEGYLQESRGKKVPLIRFSYGDKDDMFDAHSYNKGGRVLHMLRSILGDEAFFLSLNQYLKNNEFGDAEAHSLRLACEQVTGLDLNWFFDQWFFNAGHPELSIRYEYVDSLNEQRVIVEQTQDLEQSTIFKFPIKVDLYASGDKTEYEFVVEHLIDTLRMPSSAEPSYVNFDAEKVLLCTRDDQKPESWWQEQYSNATNFTDRYIAVAEAFDNTRPISSVLIDALDDPSWHLRDYAVKGIGFLPHNELLELEDQVILLTRDERSNVRAAALTRVGSDFGGPDSLRVRDGKPFHKYMDLLVKSLKDPSYLVMANALTAIARIDYDRAAELAEGLEDENSSEIMLAIAKMHAYDGGPEHNEFYTRKLAESSPNEKFELIMYYSLFLVNQEDEVFNSNLHRVVEIAEIGDPWWIKYAAYLGMDSMLDQLNVPILDETPDDSWSPEQLDGFSKIKKRVDLIKKYYNGSLEKETDSRILSSIVPK